MIKHKLESGAEFVMCGSKSQIPPNSVIFELTTFKKSGKFYAKGYIYLSNYSPTDLENLKCSNKQEDNQTWWVIYKSIVDYVKEHKNIFDGMYIVINCEDYWPTLIPIQNS